MRGLYIHIPFCKTICSYCDFPKRLGNPELYETYIHRLLEEIDSYQKELTDITSVYIGGGTPNVLPLSLLEKLFIKIEPQLIHSKENSIELNPELITEDLCRLLNKYHFNRVSMGIQSVNEKNIKILNRHHTKDDIINSFTYLRKNNITNINCDFMFGIPGSDLNTVKEDLDFILKFQPTHLSYYTLIIEEHTVLSYKIAKGLMAEPDEDNEADIYDYINQRLKNEGFKHYEVSNYAKPGLESMHNKLYWTEMEYVGCGIGASGFLNHQRYTNNMGINSYLNAFSSESEQISVDEEKSEFMMLGLRMLEGISISEYRKRYNSDPKTDFPVIEELKEKGLLAEENDHLRIPEEKMFLGNVVWREFV